MERLNIKRDYHLWVPVVNDATEYIDQLIDNRCYSEIKRNLRKICIFELLCNKINKFIISHNMGLCFNIQKFIFYGEILQEKKVA